MDIDIIKDTEMDNGIMDECEEEILNEIPNNKEDRLKFYVQRIKLSAAIAIIRSTPPEMTPEMYASQLAQIFKEDDNKWKMKYETLERELIALEEKLQTFTLKDKFNIPDVEMNFQMHDKRLDPISQSGIQPPSDLKKKICNTIEFVRSFILLGSVAQFEIEKNKVDDREKLGETVLRSISLLFGYLRTNEGLSMEFEIIKCAMEEVNRLFDSKANFFEKDLIKSSMAFVENLLLDIYKTLEINMVEYQHRRSTLIQMLAEQRKLTALILSRLLREITILSDSLSSTLNSSLADITPLLRVENTYYVLQTTEGTLHIMRQQKSALNFLRIPKSLIFEWNKTAEKSLLDIGLRFPMYSIYVWHIKTLLKSIFDSNIENEEFGH